MPHQHRLINLRLAEPAGLLGGEEHFHGHLFATPLSHPNFPVATLPNLFHHLNLLSDSPLDLLDPKTHCQYIHSTTDLCNLFSPPEKKQLLHLNQSQPVYLSFYLIQQMFLVFLYLNFHSILHSQISLLRLDCINKMPVRYNNYNCDSKKKKKRIILCKMGPTAFMIKELPLFQKYKH